MPIAVSRAADTRLRRFATQLGYRLHKSRLMLGINNLGGYRIVDPDLNAVMAGEHFDMGAKEVEDWLNGHAEGRLAGLLRQ